MTKTEQTRLAGWRFKVLQRAAECHSVARTCRHFRYFPPSLLQVEEAI